MKTKITIVMYCDGLAISYTDVNDGVTTVLSDDNGGVTTVLRDEGEKS